MGVETDKRGQSDLDLRIEDSFLVQNGLATSFRLYYNVFAVLSV